MVRYYYQPKLLCAQWNHTDSKRGACNGRTFVWTNFRTISSTNRAHTSSTPINQTQNHRILPLRGRHSADFLLKSHWHSGNTYRLQCNTPQSKVHGRNRNRQYDKLPGRNYPQNSQTGKWPYTGSLFSPTRSYHTCQTNTPNINSQQLDS